MIELELIIEKIKNGQPGFYSVLVEEFQQPIFRYCYYMLGQREEAEDATQEVFFKAYQKLASYQSGTNFSAWLFTIAHNYCVNNLRHQKIIKFIPLKLDRLVLQTTIDSHLETQELSKELKKALECLSAVERSIILFRVLEEKKYQEIAKLLDYKPATLRKKYQRACQKLQKILMTRKGGKESGFDIGPVT